MNLDLSDEQQVVSDLAAKLFADLATTERVKAVEAAGGFDRDLWRELADAGLLAVALPEHAGGSGMGMVALNLIADPARAHRRTGAARAVGRHGARRGPSSRGERGASARGRRGGRRDRADQRAGRAGRERRSPIRPSTPPRSRAAITSPGGSQPSRTPSTPRTWWSAASVDGAAALFVVDTAQGGVSVDPVDTTDRQPAAHLTFDVDVRADDRIGDGAALAWLAERMLVARSAVQLGVCEGSLATTAEYVATREQFGRPLATFQAVSQRAADSLHHHRGAAADDPAGGLAPRRGSRRPREEALIAAWWAADGGQQVVLAGQHLHGGIGADVDYPVHRYFLWGSQLGNEPRLGERPPVEPRPADRRHRREGTR